MPGKDSRRKDKNRKVLKTGEVQRKDGYYVYRWTTRNGTRRSVSAKTLEELRKKEEEISRDKSDGIREAEQNITLNHMFELWKSMKRGLKDNTLQNYIYMYQMFVEPDLGKLRIKTLRKSDEIGRASCRERV